MEIPAVTTPTNRRYGWLIAGGLLWLLGFNLIGMALIVLYALSAAIRYSTQLIWVPLALLATFLFGASPLIIGLIGMELESSSTGITANESNSVFGVLPWLTMGTMAIAAPIAALIVAGGIVHALILRQNRRGLPKASPPEDVGLS